MIKSFQQKRLAEFFLQRLSLPKLKPIAKRLLNRLKVLHRERSWTELKNFFGTDLEQLKGDLQGWYSLRVNDQYRIVFQWGKDNHAYEVVLTKHYQKIKI